MKAMAVTAPGCIEYVSDFPDPELADGRTLLRIRAVGLNRLDLMGYTGEVPLSYPHVLGADIVAEVVQCPSGAFSTGARVFVNPALPEDSDAGWGTNRSCDYVRILGLHVDGGLAEFAVVPDEQIYLVPRHLSDEEAAAIPLDCLTAWRMLTSRAEVAQGEHVLIWGAAGPLGCAAIAICAHLGAHPIAASSRRSDAAKLRELGAIAWVDYNVGSFLDDVKSAANGRVDVVFESVGAASWSKTMEIVAPRGRVVLCGTTSGSNAPTDLTELYYKQVSVLGSRMGYPSEFETMVSAVASRSLPPLPVAATFGMSETEGALDYLVHRDRPGKVVVVHDL